MKPLNTRKARLLSAAAVASAGAVVTAGALALPASAQPDGTASQHTPS